MIGFFLIMMVITSVIYPAVITAAANVAFGSKAQGSIITGNDGKKYGSALLAQEFTGSQYLWGRIMNVDTSTFTDENGEPLMYSWASNKTPAGEELEDPVSVGVPEVVIHVFKVVEIGKGEAERRMGILIGFLCAAEFAHGQFEECTPVEEPGQNILVRRHPVPFKQPGKLLGLAMHLPAHLVECLGEIPHERHGLRIIPLRDALHLPRKMTQVGLCSLE